MYQALEVKSAAALGHAKPQSRRMAARRPDDLEVDVERTREKCRVTPGERHRVAQVRRRLHPVVEETARAHAHAAAELQPEGFVARALDTAASSIA